MPGIVEHFGHFFPEHLNPIPGSGLERVAFIASLVLAVDSFLGRWFPPFRDENIGRTVGFMFLAAVVLFLAFVFLYAATQ